MALDDLIFNKKEANRILELAVEKEKEKLFKIDTAYDTSATYQDLMKVAKERGLKKEVIECIVEDKRYKLKNRIYEVLKDNVAQFFVGGFSGFLVGAGLKYFGINFFGYIDPITYAFGTTAISDFIELGLISNKRGNLKKTLQNDVGTFSGQFLGYCVGCYVGSILKNMFR